MSRQQRIGGIPDPQPDLISLHRTVVALKNAVDLMTGQVGDDAHTSRVYVQDNTPDRPKKGDLWIGSTRTVYWNGRSWEQLP